MTVGSVVAEATPFAYVTTNSNAVSVIDTAVNTEVATVSVGLPARGVGITPNGALAYVTDRLYTPWCDDFLGVCYGAWSSSIIDTATETVVGSVLLTTCGPEQQSACPPPEPGSVAITPDGAFAYMTKYETGYSVSVVPTTANNSGASVWMGNAMPFGVAVRPDGAMVYVTVDVDGPNGFVGVIDTVSKTLVATVAVGLAPRGVAFTPNSRFAYVANSGSSSVSVIDTATNALVGTVPMPGGSSPFDVAITPDGAFAYVTNRGSNTVSVIATATQTVVATVPGFSDPNSVAITPDGAFAYVTNFGSNTVSVIATTTQTVVATVAVTGQPVGVAVTVGGPPPPGVTSVLPGLVGAGGDWFNLTLFGTGFLTSSVVEWNGSPRATTYVSPGLLTAQVSAADIASPGSASVAVSNPGGTSNATAVTISPPSKDAVAFQINPAHTGVINFNSASLPSGRTWQVTLGGTPSYALIAAGKVFVTVSTASGSQLVALDQASGNIMWGPIAMGGQANAVYDNGTLFVLSAQSGVLGAYDASSGSLKWSVQPARQQQPSFFGAPMVADGLVFVVTDGTVLVVNQSDGSLNWELLWGGRWGAVTADGVYVAGACESFDLMALGAVNWDQYPGCSGGGGGTPVVANHIDYSPDMGSGGHQYDAETGAVLGTYTADNPPAVGPQTGFFLSGGTLLGVALASNAVLWSFAGDGMLATSPIVVNRYVFIGSSSGNLYAVDAQTGQQLWQDNLGASIPSNTGWTMPLSGLSAGDGLLLVPAGNTLTAYTLSTIP